MHSYFVILLMLISYYYRAYYSLILFIIILSSSIQFSSYKNLVIYLHLPNYYLSSRKIMLLTLCYQTSKLSDLLLNHSCFECYNSLSNSSNTILMFIYYSNMQYVMLYFLTNFVNSQLIVEIIILNLLHYFVYNYNERVNCLMNL